MSADTHVTVGSYIASRLSEAGVRHYFAVPGDYNLILLDEFLKNGDLKMISCCNELNAGYAADGYARANGVAAQVVTFSVGGLSALNAIAGAYARGPVCAHNLGRAQHEFRNGEPDTPPHLRRGALRISEGHILPYHGHVRHSEAP